MIVTLATQIIFRGISEIVLGSGGSISASNTDGFRAIGGKIGNVPYILFLVVILSVIFAVILGKSTFGRRVYAIGTNRLTAYYSGVHVQKIRFIIYTIMGTVSGLCALFLVSSSYGANTTTGNGFEMDAIAMAVFGGISSTGGKGNIAGGIYFRIHHRMPSCRSWSEKRQCTGYPADHRCTSDRCSSSSEHHRKC